MNLYYTTIRKSRRVMSNPHQSQTYYDPYHLTTAMNKVLHNSNATTKNANTVSRCLSYHVSKKWDKAHFLCCQLNGISRKLKNQQIYQLLRKQLILYWCRLSLIVKHRVIRMLLIPLPDLFLMISQTILCL